MTKYCRIIILIYPDRFITGTSSHRGIPCRNLCFVQCDIAADQLDHVIIRQLGVGNGQGITLSSFPSII